MNINYLMSLLLTLFTCIATIKILNFININKLKRSSIVTLFAINLFLFCISYAFELAADTKNFMIYTAIMRTMFFGFLPPLSFLIFIDIAKKTYKLKTLHYVLLFSIPVINLILAITSQNHTLFFYDYSIISLGNLKLLAMKTGAWFYLISLYSIIVFTIAFAELFKHLKSIKKNRPPIIMLLALIILSFACIIGYLFLVNSFISFLMPFFIPISCLILSINYVTSKLFGVIPFAYKKAFEWSDSPILILDSDLNLIDFNEVAQDSIPLLNNETIYKNIDEFLDYDGRIKSCIITDSECRIRIIKDYDVRHYRVSSSALLGKHHITHGYMISLIDISELVETMAELTELASIDTLTRTNTRGYFIERTELEFARAKRHAHPLSFIILDLDHFKRINDEYGHIAGDVLLKEVADICKTKIRSIDLLGRFGGEEFMMLLPETNLESAITAAERIRQKIEETKFHYEGKVMRITASLGVTGSNKISCENFDKFLHSADIALYKAKDNGRNKVEYSPLG